MILSSKTIPKMISDKTLEITPVEQKRIQSAGVDGPVGQRNCTIKLKSGHRVGQLVFSKMDTATAIPYNGKYQGQRGATGSPVFMRGCTVIAVS